MKNIYVLIRIPKCGSTSLENMVKHALPGNNLYPLSTLVEADGLSIIERIRLERNMLSVRRRYGAFSEKAMWRNISNESHDGDIVSAHMPYGAIKLDGCNYRYITLLRDPVERVVSAYYYSRHSYQKLPFHRRLYRTGSDKAAGNKSFSGFLEYLSANKNLYSNPMVRYITGDGFHEDPFGFLQENYFHFGVLEEINLFAQQLGDKLGCEIPAERSNVTKEKSTPEFSAKEMELINDLYEGDIQLYRNVKELVLSV